MAEAPDNSSNEGNQNNEGKGGGSKPDPKPAATTTVDVSQLSGDDLAKVLENKELWKQPRLANLLNDSKELKKMQDAQSEAENKALEEQKKFEELAKKHADENTALKQQIQDNAITQALTGVLVGSGVVDLDAALKLVNRGEIKIDDSGQATGVQEAIDALKTDKAYLFNNSGGTTVGAASNQTGTGTGTQPGGYKFKESQLTPAFYKEHEAEILEAYKNGQIEQDGPPPLTV